MTLAHSLVKEMRRTMHDLPIFSVTPSFGVINPTLVKRKLTFIHSDRLHDDYSSSSATAQR
jgi:hypothetical protein